jgi:hypothetical protein
MHIRYDNQQGVILVMTIVIMSILLATGLGFTVLVLSDLRQAQQIDNGIVAYHAANSGIEEGLYWLRKDIDGTDIATVDALKNIAITKPLANDAVWDISDSTDYQSNISRERLYNGQSLKFYLLGRSGASPSNTTESIGIVWERDAISPTTQLQVVATQLDYQETESDALIYYTDTNKVITNPDPDLDCVPLLDAAIPGNSDADYDYVFEVRALGETENDVIKSLRIRAYNTDNCTDENNEGITNISLVSTGRYRASQQTITAYVPPRDPVSGLFGFVLFSQEDITKDNE